MNYSYKQLSGSDVSLLNELLKVFGEAFEDLDTYRTKGIYRPFLGKIM